MSDFRQLLGMDSKAICKRMDACPTVRMAYVLLLEGKSEEAEIRFQRILNDDPRNSDAYAGLAICMAEESGRYRSASRLAQKAVQIDPQSVSGYYALAYLNLKGSRLEEGYRLLMKARRLAPRDPRIACGLQMYERERPPVISDLSRLHPLNQFLGEARTFLRTTVHKAISFVLVLEGAFRSRRLIS